MMEYTEDQRKFIEGVRDFLTEDFPRPDYISLQGSAGTGKSVCISQLSKEFPSYKFIYVAYTGKACSSLMTKGIPAQTIYSTFYKVKKDTSALEFELLPKTEGPNCDVIVIDEVSMIPQSMFNDLLSFGKKIIAVGDRKQLGPVKANLNTILDNPDFVLTTVHRQAGNSGIIRLYNYYSKHKSFPGYGRFSDDVEIISKDQVTEEMILSVDQTICGINSTRVQWNTKIRRANKRYDYFPEKGERVICCRNSPIYIGERRIINGTTGVVENVKLKGGNNLLLTFRPDWAEESVTLKVNGENFITGGTPSSGANVYCFDFAYVITVNKAQGSEWNSVLYIVDKEIPGESFYRNVITGITRAKKKLILAY